jgi:hypothetical protein
MQTYKPGVLTIATLALASACASTVQPAAKAASVERMQCEPSAAGQDAEHLVRSTTVLSVEPIYSHVLTASNSEDRVNGAKLVVRPPQGVNADQMTRILQCHSARILLGQVNGNAIANDPYWLPDTWVNIEVKPENGNFAITVSADSLRDDLRIYSRVNRYADDHRVATDPELP